ncbi:MAG: hypothetical protein L0215_04720 [Gemmataceae bacterium]|nr:hypothetical protein [Gemmataceae bacterium]
MATLEFSFVEEARSLEVDAIDGGRPLHEFTLDPQTSSNDEEIPIMGRSVDDAEEITERAALIQLFLPYARLAYEQRGLVYPFQKSEAGDSFEIVPGQERVAARSAELSRMIRKGQPVSKQFEQLAFEALHRYVGGWGVCIGAPRNNGRGAKHAIEEFRNSLRKWEIGESWPEDFARNGDHGADGFVILGRGWCGPIIFYQAKNTNFHFKDHPEEFARMPEILHDWFGKRWSQFRLVVPVFATNSVLTIEMKDRIFEARGASGVHMLDAVDILCADFIEPQHWCRQHQCIVY